MASRILNRRELREQADQASQPQDEPTALDATPGTVPPKKKTSRAPAKRKPRTKKEPPRLRARWCVCDASMKQVAVFDYNQRAAADAKLADLLARKKGLFFLQIIKEPMPETASLEAPQG
jgi:hypothetical protein